MNRLLLTFLREGLPKIPENLAACEIAGETYKSCDWKSFERTHYPQYDVCNGPLDK